MTALSSRFEGSALNTLSRLKGIETTIPTSNYFPVLVTLNTLSRLKGIETIDAGSSAKVFNPLNTLSRLKGIETVVSKETKECL